MFIDELDKQISPLIVNAMLMHKSLSTNDAQALALVTEQKGRHP